MATVKLKFRPSMVQGREGTLYYKVTHKRVVRQINTKFKLHSYEWSEALSTIIIPQNDKTRKQHLEKVCGSTLKEINELREIIRTLDESHKSYTTSDVVCQFTSMGDNGFFAYAESVIVKLKMAHMPVANKYKTSIRKFKSFLGDKELAFPDITQSLMQDFENSMKGKVSRNTSSFYLRNLHAIYNRAMDEGLVAEGINPFHRVYTGVDKTQKRAISPSDIKRVKNYDLTGIDKIAFARDLFMFSFYTRGMSFIDMAYLEKSNIIGDHLVYRRSKTGQEITIKWMPEMEAIVKRYANDCTGDYLLPILTSTDYEESRKQYDSEEHKANRQLKKLGKLLGLVSPLTMYVARHSWATAAQTNKIPLSIISQSMGHDSEKTTRIYLASIDTAEIDDANEKVIRSIM